MEHGHHSGMWVPEDPPTWARMFLPHLDPWSVLPVLALLAAPVTLALRTLPRGQGPAGVPRALLLNALHSRFARFVSHPLFTIPLFIASLYGVYFTPLFDALMSNPAGHQLMLAHFVVVGLLFFGPIVAQDPWPRWFGCAGRVSPGRGGVCWPGSAVPRRCSPSRAPG